MTDRNLLDELMKLLSRPGPVNWALAEQLAGHVSGDPEAIDPWVADEYIELARLVQLKVPAATGLATDPTLEPVLVGRKEWARLHIRSFRYLVDPMADRLDDMGSGPFGGLIKPLGPVLLGMNAGALAGTLSRQALGSFDAGLPVSEPSGHLVVDIGGGTTDIAVISLSGIVYGRSVRLAGHELDDSIIRYIRAKHNLLIGERTAEQIKIEVGSAYPLDEPVTMEIKGRNLVEGIPKTVVITDGEIREALAEGVGAIVNAIRAVLEKTPPELSADIVDQGLILTGGGALLRNLDKCIREETGLPVTVAEDPLSCVVRGTGQMLGDFDLLKKISVDSY